MMEEKQTSPWVYIAIGCSIPIILVVVLLGTAVYWGYRTVSHVRDDTPEERARRVQQVLGCEKIPEGYHPMLAISVPFFMEMAMLSDRPAEFKDGRRGKAFDERGLIFANVRGGDRQRKFRDYVDGTGDTTDGLGEGDVRIQELEAIRRGEFDLPGSRVRWSTNRGSVRAQGSPLRGLVTLYYFDCAQADGRLRLGIWFGPDPKSSENAAEADYTGTNADEAEIREFVSHFSPCPAP